MSDGDLTGAVSEAGGLGVIGASWLSPDQVTEMAARARELTAKPFGVNLLLFGAEDLLDAALAVRARGAVDRLGPPGSGSRRDLRASSRERREGDAHGGEARRGGARGGGRRRRDRRPGLRGWGPRGRDGDGCDRAPGREGRGSAAGRRRRRVRRRRRACLRARARARRRLARHDLPRHARRARVPDWYKQAIVDSDGHDTVVTTVADTYSGRDWPGAWGRVLRTPMIEEWLGREPELRRRRAESAPSSRRRGRTRRRTRGRSEPASRRGSSTRCCLPATSCGRSSPRRRRSFARCRELPHRAGDGRAVSGAGAVAVSAAVRLLQRRRASRL